MVPPRGWIPIRHLRLHVGRRSTHNYWCSLSFSFPLDLVQAVGDYVCKRDFRNKSGSLQTAEIHDYIDCKLRIVLCGFDGVVELPAFWESSADLVPNVLQQYKVELVTNL